MYIVKREIWLCNLLAFIYAFAHRSPCVVNSTLLELSCVWFFKQLALFLTALAPEAAFVLSVANCRHILPFQYICRNA